MRHLRPVQHLSLCPHTTSLPLSLLPHCSHPAFTHLFPLLCSSLFPLPQHIAQILPYSFCLLFFSSFLLFALPHSLSPSAAVSRPRHPTLPSAADINQPLCGKQREGRREREGWKKREKASRQPVIRTNVDGLHIAGWEEQNSFASLFYIKKKKNLNLTSV